LACNAVPDPGPDELLFLKEAVMIRLTPELFADLDGTIGGLRRALQNAIELEHSTIPPYLYALYSIKPGSNPDVAGLIKSIVVQEMLHMALDCNVLNAISGEPDIDNPAFIPRYPGPLPGGVEGDLTVGLAPLSKQLIKDCFMVIEEPENPRHFPVLTLAAGARPETIGQFYAEIVRQLKDLSAQGNVFTGDPRRRLTTRFGPLQTIHVHDLDTSVEAINLIVEQGEGTRTSPLDSEHQPAHYYRYAEIYYGKMLIPNPDQSPGAPEFVYGGHNIGFDPAGIWPVITNPGPDIYPPGSKARNLNDTFNYTYTSLLKSLQLVFNGQTDRLGPAIGLMESMKEQALTMMSTPTVPGQTAGPTFVYTPVNPQV
jgi:Ferritin-like